MFGKNFSHLSSAAKAAEGVTAGHRGNWLS